MINNTPVYMTPSQKVLHKIKNLSLYMALEKHLTGCKSVLDVGCGDESPIKYIKKNFKSEGIDIYRPSIAKSKKAKIHDSYKLGNITKLDKYYKPKSFDAVVMLDVIEHFKKNQALEILAKAHKIAKKRVIILTPNGFHDQDHFDGNPYQRHKSGWENSDFSKLGYKVYGLRGYKSIRGECATIRLKPWIFWGTLTFFTEPIFYFLPSLSYHLFAVKNSKKK